MIKIKFLPVLIITAIFAVPFFLIMWALASAVFAQGEPPAPYVGLKNPFPWDDTSAQEAGKKLYQESCGGCHGAKGSNLPDADFSRADFAQTLEKSADFYFWILSEGRLSRGMPPFKSSLSEEQRWQALTYLWSLGKTATPPGESPPPSQPEKTGSLVLTAPPPAQTGQPVILVTTLKDGQGKPIEDATVKFFVRVDFFTSGLMAIGEALTNSQGVATLKYSSRQAGDIAVVAHYETIEATTTLSLAESNGPFYQPEAGIKLPGMGNDVYVGPHPTYDPGQPVDAPTGAFRLPGGILSWLLLIVATVILIWTTYFRVVYQIFRIPSDKDITDIDTRLIPRVILGVIVVLGLLLVLVLLHGPYSHLHLLR